jgi:polysaccharide biosynthesis protein PslA
VTVQTDVGPFRDALLRGDDDAPPLAAAVRALATRRHIRGLLRAATLAGDLVAVVLAFVVAAGVMWGEPLGAQASGVALATVPAFLLLAWANHAYTAHAVCQAWDGSRRAILSFLAALALVGATTFFLKVTQEVSRSVVGLGGVTAVALLAAVRLLIARAAARHVGGAALNEVLIQDGRHVPAEPGILVLDAERDGVSTGLDDPIIMDRLGRFLKAADRVVVACAPAKRERWVSMLKAAGVDGEVLADEIDHLGAVGLGSYAGTTTLVVASGPLALGDRVLKRTLDLLLCLILLPLLALPMLAIALAIKLDSAGPVFFRQPRVGLGNRVFSMYKFRSMAATGSDRLGSQSTRRGDPRITRVGRFIRATSLDEVPQILNVLAGSMSIVGPRPHPLECKAEDRLFWEIDERYWHRHAVKPGMTGLAQVRGFRGATEKEADLVNRLHADLEYMAGWTIWRDLAIIVATFRVLMHRNAF